MNRAGDSFHIVGAGPAGLAAAITLARSGARVVVHEAHASVGYRFQGDLQGLENWSTQQDVLTALQQLGITTEFEMHPCDCGVVFDAWGNAYPVASRQPLFYMVMRGPGESSLDSALLKQAHALDIEVRFESRVTHVPQAGVLAVGPRAADAIAVGYHFETDMPDGFWAICDDRLAPKGYAYLLVMHGRGTVKSCMFSGFKQERMYVERTVATFQRLVGLRMRNPRPHGGVGNFHLPVSAYSGRHPVAGEQAGFQDALWGFGMRYAIESGVLAARSLIQSGDYDAFWRAAFANQVQASLINRACYSLVGNRGYRWLLRLQARGDARDFLRRCYESTPLRRWLWRWAAWRQDRRRQDASCNHLDCECVWCRCGGEYA